MPHSTGRECARRSEAHAPLPHKSEVSPRRDWNPWAHALDTAEMMASVGLTLDWLYDYADSNTRQVLQTAILEKGLTPWRLGLQNGSWWWLNNTINWNAVCAGGGIIGALAVADVAPSWVWDEVATAMLTSIPSCIGAYSSEGSWMEGVGYWGYASKYAVLTMASLSSALNTTYGLAQLPGVDVAGRFPIFSTGPSAQVRG